MKILVLGGNGFIGGHALALLAQTSHKVVSLSREDRFDLLNLPAVEERLRKENPDAIINCAAHVGSLHYVSQYAADVFQENARMAIHLYIAVQQVCPKAKIVNPISNCSYPGAASIQREKKYWDGAVHQSVWSFGNSRRMEVVLSQCFAQQYGIRSVNFFAPNAYGPRDHTDPNRTHALNGMVIRMVKAKRNGDPEFEIWGSGKPKREWIYAKDLATMLVYAAENIENQIDPINIAQNKAYSIRETAEMIKEAMGYKGKLVFNTKYQDGDPIKKLDDKLFRRKYPDFSFTDIKKGIQNTINYYQNIL